MHSHPTVSHKEARGKALTYRQGPCCEVSKCGTGPRFPKGSFYIDLSSWPESASWEKFFNLLACQYSGCSLPLHSPVFSKDPATPCLCLLPSRLSSIAPTITNQFHCSLQMERRHAGLEGEGNLVEATSQENFQPSLFSAQLPLLTQDALKPLIPMHSWVERQCMLLPGMATAVSGRKESLTNGNGPPGYLQGE